MADIERLRRDLQEARARRLQPHYIEGFFRVALARADGTLVSREPGRWEIPHVPAAVRECRRGVVPIPLRYERVCFDQAAVRLDRGVPAQLVAPGHPLLDALVDHTARTCGDALTRGTILVDRLDPAVEPRLMVALREEIVDGMGRIVGRRYGYLEMWRDGRSRPGSAPFLDYDQPTGPERALLSDLPELPWLADATTIAQEWATGHDLPEWYARVSARRRQLVARTRDLVRERLEQEVAFWQEQAAELDALPPQARRHGKTLRAARDEAARLRHRLDRRLSDLDIEEHTQVRPPVIQTVALVVPQGLLDARTGAGELPVTETLEIELRALHAVLAAERRLGRKPESMAHNNPGYDLRSVDADNHLVHIEVKGRIAGAGEFFVTNREIRVGQNADQYRLALVEVSPRGPGYDQVRYLQRPFAGVQITTLVHGVQFKWREMWDRSADPW